MKLVIIWITRVNTLELEFEIKKYGKYNYCRSFTEFKAS